MILMRYKKNEKIKCLCNWFWKCWCRIELQVTLVEHRKYKGLIHALHELIELWSKAKWCLKQWLDKVSGIWFQNLQKSDRELKNVQTPFRKTIVVLDGIAEECPLYLEKEAELCYEIQYSFRYKWWFIPWLWTLLSFFYWLVNFRWRNLCDLDGWYSNALMPIFQHKQEKCSVQCWKSGIRFIWFYSCLSLYSNYQRCLDVLLESDWLECRWLMLRNIFLEVWG